MPNKKYIPMLTIPILMCTFSLGIYGQSIETRLILLDSSEFEGYGKIIKGNKILFRMDLEDEPDKWDGTQVKRIEFDHGFKIVAFEYVKIGNYKPTLYRVIEPGFMTLYAYDESYWTLNRPVENGLMSGSYRVTTTSYYIKRDDKEFLCSVPRNKNAWKKRLVNCFEDCPEIMETINSKNVTDYEIEDLVWNFNEYCGGVKN